MVDAPSRRETRLFIVATVVLGIAVYALSLGNDFVFWDDPLLITDNATARGVTIENVARAFTTYDPDLYVPVTMLSYQLNYLIGGLHPFIYHLTNLALHIGSALLVAWVAMMLFHKRAVAAVASLLFLLHPINVEAVAWASARKDVLSGFFFFLTFWSYLYWREDERRRGWYVAGIVSFLLGLLSKVSILGLPFVLLSADWYETKTVTKKRVLPAVPFFVLSAALGFVAIFGKMGGVLPPWSKILLGMRAVLFSLWHLTWPFGYSVLYPYRDAVTLADAGLLLSLVAVLGVTVATFLWRKRWPGAFLCWIWVLVLLAPSFFTVEKGADLIPEPYLTSDRYMYTAAVGAFFLAGLVIRNIWNRHPKAGLAAVALPVAAFAALSLRQTLVWRDTETLLTHALETNPESAIARNNLGAYYNGRGRKDAAMREFAEAIRHGGTSDAWFNVGVAAMQGGKPKEAMAAFARAIDMRPTNALAHLNVGALLLDEGEIQLAVDSLLRSQALDPRNVTTYLNLGIALEKGGNPTDAVRAYERALQLEPQNAYANDRLAALRPKQ